eukprot:gene13835-16350_t
MSDKLIVASANLETSQSLYDLLGVDISASTGTIKRAFRLRSKVIHPDIPVTGDAVRFKELKEATALLVDEVSRTQYDRRLLSRVGAE